MCGLSQNDIYKFHYNINLKCRNIKYNIRNVQKSSTTTTLIWKQAEKEEIKLVSGMEYAKAVAGLMMACWTMSSDRIIIARVMKSKLTLPTYM